MEACDCLMGWKGKTVGLGLWFAVFGDGGFREGDLGDEVDGIS